MRAPPPGRAAFIYSGNDFRLVAKTYRTASPFPGTPDFNAAKAG
jgi:hypothetical protein